MIELLTSRRYTSVPCKHQLVQRVIGVLEYRFISIFQSIQPDSEDLFLADPLPQRPPDGDSSTTRHVLLDNTMQSEMADRSALYDEEEIDAMARDQYEPVSAWL